jgi:predicted lipoprotein with Yx(FWY)xxD motif
VTSHIPLRPAVTTVVGLAVAIAALGCGGAKTKAPAAVTAPTSVGAATSQRPTSSRGASVTVATTRFGPALMTGKHFALYSFSADPRGHSRCYRACAKAWPPLLTKGTPVAAGGARNALLGTTHRKDGSMQVTYRGHPLYRYVGDVKPRQVLCQNVNEYGGLWRVVSPAGNAIR